MNTTRFRTMVMWPYLEIPHAEARERNCSSRTALDPLEECLRLEKGGRSACVSRFAG